MSDMTCASAADALWLWLDGTLDPADVAALGEHTATCPACQQALFAAVRTERLLIQRSMALPIPAPPSPTRRWTGWGLTILAVVATVVAAMMLAPDAELPPAPTPAPVTATSPPSAPVSTIAPTSAPGLRFVADAGVVKQPGGRLRSWRSQDGTVADLASGLGPRVIATDQGIGLCFRGDSRLQAHLPPAAAHGAGTLIVAAYGDGPQADERLVTLVGADGQEELAVAWTSATHSVRILVRGTPTLPVVVPKDFPVVVCRWRADGRLEVQAPGALHATTVVGNAPGPATALIIGGGARGTPGFHGDIWSCLWRPTVVADQEMVDLLRTCGWEPPFSNVSPL